MAEWSLLCRCILSRPLQADLAYRPQHCQEDPSAYRIRVPVREPRVHLFFLSEYDDLLERGN